MSDNDDFWTNLIKTAFVGKEEHDFAGNYLTASEKEEAANVIKIEAAVEHRMFGKELNGDHYSSMHALTEAGRAKDAVQLPIAEGTRVRFYANTGSLLTYDNAPAGGTDGVVVSVRTASGMITDHDGRVFVKWADTGSTIPIYAEHLRLANGTMRKPVTGAAKQIRVASLGDLTEFLRIASTDTLVHKATRDLWSLKKDQNGYMLERLFKDDGNPLKG